MISDNFVGSSFLGTEMNFALSPLPSFLPSGFALRFVGFVRGQQ